MTKVNLNQLYAAAEKAGNAYYVRPGNVSVNQDSAAYIALTNPEAMKALIECVRKMREVLGFYGVEWTNPEMDEEIKNGGFFPYSIDETVQGQDRGNKAVEALAFVNERIEI